LSGDDRRPIGEVPARFTSARDIRSRQVTMIMQRLQNTRSFTFQEITKTTPSRRSAARRAKATSDMSQSRSLGAAAILRTDFGDGFGDCCDERFDGSGGDLADTQRGDECRGLPVSPRYAGHQALTARAAAIATRHVGRCASLVDENQAFRVQFALARTSSRAWATSERSCSAARSDFFEREFEKLEPVPQAPDADIDLALGE